MGHLAFFFYLQFLSHLGTLIWTGDLRIKGLRDLGIKGLRDLGILGFWDLKGFKGILRDFKKGFMGYKGI